MQLANGGQISHLGCSSNGAANLVLNGGTLKYAGAAVAIDRLFGLGANGGTLDASGSGALSLTNSGAAGFVDNGAHTLALAGTNTGANTLAASLSDNGGATALMKNGAGAWTLSGPNSFSGGTIVSGGTLTLGPSGTLGTGNLSVSNGAVCVIQNAGALSSGAYVYLNGTLNLAYSGTNTVGRLYIGGVLQPAGVWNAARDAAHFAGTGSLSVSAGSATGPIVLQARGLSGGGLQLTWTNSAVDLYYTPSLTPPVAWSPVTNQAGFSNGQWTLTLPTGTNGNGFYRLRQ
jgi:fibronectin-binding autotransporter adhesin